MPPDGIQRLVRSPLPALRADNHPGLRYCLDHAADAVAPSLVWESLTEDEREQWVAAARTRLASDDLAADE
jgi:hypothetical protein